MRTSGSIEARGLAGVREETEEAGEEGLRRLQEEVRDETRESEFSSILFFPILAACACRIREYLHVILSW